jgi:hypothetical protein
LRLAEIEKKEASSVFPEAETQDFEYIWRKLDRYEPVTFRHTTGKGDSKRDLNP